MDKETLRTILIRGMKDECVDVIHLMGKWWNMMRYVNFVEGIHRKPPKMEEVLSDVGHEMIFPELQNQLWGHDSSRNR